MERLSFIDQMMHKVSTSKLPSLNMQGAMIVDPSKSPFKIDATIIAEHICARLQGFSLLRKKLVQDPFKMGDLRMIDDEHFDPMNHISFATLPSPGDKRTLDRHMGLFSARELKPDIPLWQFEIIEGLEDGKIAVIQKLSHATMDGMAAMKIMQSLFDLEPLPPEKPDQYFDYDLDTAPTQLKLLGSATKENIERYGISMPKTLLSLSKMAAGGAKNYLKLRFSNDSDSPPDTIEEAEAKPEAAMQETSLNGSISSDKRVMTAAIYELDKLKSIAKAYGCTINDICLTMTSEALAHYFAGIGEEVNDLFFVMPMSTRAADDKNHGNALTLSKINARNTISSITDRLQKIHADTSEAKSNRSDKKSKGTTIENPTAMLSPLLVDALTKLLQNIQPWGLISTPVNAIMSNVPGSREGAFFAGMPIDYQIPLIPIFHKAALAIGVTSMGNVFSFGFHGCGKTVKERNIHLLTDGLDIAYQALVKNAPKAPAKRTAKTAAAKKRAVKKAPVKPQPTA
jgi:WS/DGAT/MGAT family acyltransferase